MADNVQCVSTHNCNILSCIQKYKWQLQYTVTNTYNHKSNILICIENYATELQHSLICLITELKIQISVLPQ